MLNKIILASQSKVRKEILDKNDIPNKVEPSNVDEDIVKESLLKEKATPDIISKNLAELKANKVSLKKTDEIVLGADSVIDLDGELISKPKNREEALKILTSNKTTIVIAHRLSTILNSSNIYVIDSGKIVGNGKHEELLNKSKIYKNFHDKQFQR